MHAVRGQDPTKGGVGRWEEKWVLVAIPTAHAGAPTLRGQEARLSRTRWEGDGGHTTQEKMDAGQPR